MTEPLVPRNVVPTRYIVIDKKGVPQLLSGDKSECLKWANLPENFDEENWDCYEISEDHVATFSTEKLNQKRLKKYTEAKQKILRDMSLDVIEALLDGKSLKEFKDKKDSLISNLPTE